MDLPDSDRGDFSCRRAVNSSSFIWIDNCVIQVIMWHYLQISKYVLGFRHLTLFWAFYCISPFWHFVCTICWFFSYCMFHHHCPIHFKNDMFAFSRIWGLLQRNSNIFKIQCFQQCHSMMKIFCIFEVLPFLQFHVNIAVRLVYPTLNIGQCTLPQDRHMHMHQRDSTLILLYSASDLFTLQSGVTSSITGKICI